MSNQRFVIIGDGVAGASAAKTLREKDADADIVILTNEGEPLYNRVKLKDFAKGLVDENACRMHDMKWYADRNIDLRLHTPVRVVDDKNKVVICEDRSRVEFDKLLIATGGTPRRLPLPNSSVEGIFPFWTFPDARAIKAAAQEAEKGVAVGAGLLGIDIAVVFGMQGVDTKYVMRGDRWWRDGLNKEGSEIVEKALAEKGVECVFHETPTEFRVDERGRVKACVTEAGTVFDCEIAGVAVGLHFNHRILAGTKVKIGEGILTNEYLETSVPDVYAAGDITQFFDIIHDRINMNGSWANAKAQGDTAARNMVGEQVPYELVDTYTVNHFDFMVGSIGTIYGDSHVERKYGDTEWRRYVFDKGRLCGVVMVGPIKLMGSFNPVIASKMDLSEHKDKIADPDFDWKGLAGQAKDILKQREAERVATHAKA